MLLHERVIQNLEKRREVVINGGVNGIPFAYENIRPYFPSIEQARYILVTANQKVGKSKWTDYTFVYEPFFFYINNPDLIKLKIFYFTLEMSKEEKMLEFFSHLLYRIGGMRVSPMDLKSVDRDSPINKFILDQLKSPEYTTIIERFNEVVEYIDDIKNPTGINKFLREYALRKENGRFVYKEGIIKQSDGSVSEGKVIDFYEMTDPTEYRLVILDNVANLTPESGMNMFDTIGKMSKYTITLKKQLFYTMILVQHQTQAQEGIENVKLGRLKPSANGLDTNKSTAKDLDAAFGLFNPYKFELREFMGYDITKLGNWVRFVEIFEDRHNSSAGHILPLFFDGATSTFKELPSPKDRVRMNKVYELIDSYKPVLKEAKKEVRFMFLKGMFKFKKESNLWVK